MPEVPTNKRKVSFMAAIGRYLALKSNRASVATGFDPLIQQPDRRNKADHDPGAVDNTPEPL